MNSRKLILSLFLVLCLALTGCGKEKEPPIPEPPPLPADIIFYSVDQVVTAKESTNLRNYPSQGDESTIIYTLKNGETVQRTGICDNGWSQLEYKGKTCYAVSSFLTTDLDYTPAPQPESSEEEDGIQTAFTPTQQTVTAKDTVNLRSIPSVTDENSEIIAQLVNGETAECIGTSENGWSKLDYNGTICYAVSSYLTTNMNYTPPKPTTPAYMEEDGIETVFEDAEGSVTAKDTVNLRSIPSVTNPESTVLVQLHRGEVAERLGVSKTGWTKLSYNGKTCYAVTSYLTEDLDGTAEDEDPDGDGIKTKFVEVNETVTPKDAVNLRTLPSVTDPEAKVIVKLKKGQTVTRTGINEELGWSRVEYEGQTLYCVSNYIKLSDLQ